MSQNYTDTTVANLVINTLSQEDYEDIQNPSDTELYLTPDTSIDSTSVTNVWTGTQAEYNAILVKSPTTLYNVTDDISPSLSILETLYPVGSVYLSTTSTCPLASLFGTWELVASNKALWTGNGTNGGTSIEAGLPNITGKFDIRDNTAGSLDTILGKTGVFGASATSSTSKSPITASGSNQATEAVGFDASLSNSIYGNSTTVQPPAFVVNVWERTA